MPAAYQNLIIEAGSNFSASITIDDVYQEVYDLSGYSAASQMRKSYYSANAAATFTATINVGQGTITLELDAATTANIAPGRYVYDTIIIDNAYGVTTRVLEGTIDVSPRVTRV
jgi:hypothetical protein